MSAPPYMKFYVADYLAETTTLTTTEHGAYLLLLLAMWRAGGKLPRNDAKLAKIAHLTPAQWEEMQDSIMPHFKIAGGSIKHSRLVKELTKYRASSDAASEAGKRSAVQRANKNNTSKPKSVQRNSNQEEAEEEGRLEASSKASNHTRRERPEARADGASGLRVVAGQDDDEAWWEALTRAESELPYWTKHDIDQASEVAEFIAVCRDRLGLEVAA